MERGQHRQVTRTQQTRQGTQVRRNPRRRKQKYTLHYLFLFLFCIAVGITICTNVLFKVSTIQVKNNTYYSSEELISRSGIDKGDKLFGINVTDTEKMLEDRFPYLQSVNIKRRLPIFQARRENRLSTAPRPAICCDRGVFLCLCFYNTEATHRLRCYQI